MKIEAIIQNSEKVSWKLNEVLASDFLFDLSKYFIPTPSQFENSLYLSQLRAIEYARLIHTVEEFIVEQALNELKIHDNRNPLFTRLLCRFTDEEIKHQQLFSHFSSIMSLQMKNNLLIPNTSKEFSKKIMNKHPISIWLLALHGETATQFHYSEIFQYRDDIEPSFLNILKKHWQEEIQHIEIDSLIINNFLTIASESEREIILNDYLNLLRLLHDEVGISSEVIIENYQKNTSSQENNDLRKFLLKSQYDFFINISLRHPHLIEIIERLDSNNGIKRIKAQLF